MKRSLLRDCKACGNEISRHSPFCRNCGHPQGTPLMIWLLVLFLLLTMAFYLAFTIYGICHVHELRERGSSRTQPLTSAPGIASPTKAHPARPEGSMHGAASGGAQVISHVPRAGREGWGAGGATVNGRLAGGPR